MSIKQITQLVRNSGRFREVVQILAKYGLAPWLKDFVHDSKGESIKGLSKEVRIRKAIEELGTTFIKLGQILSTRPDIIGPELADELQKLQGHTLSDSPEKIKQIIKDELGASPDELFAEFNDQPIASASIGQVHRGKLKDGTEVVLKIQHFNIEDRIHNDLEILQQLASLAEQYSPELRQYQPVKTTEGLSQLLLEELNFDRELRNLQMFTGNFAHQKDIHFPIPYPKFSTQKVLTMEYLAGIGLSDKEGLSNLGVDLEEVAQRGANMFLEMIFRDGLYHADPHPGNLMILENGDLGVLDCGMVGRIDNTLQTQVEEMLIAVVNQDESKLCDIIIQLGDVPINFDDIKMRSDISAFLNNYANQSLSCFDLTGALQDIMRIIRQYKIILPPQVSLLIKVMVMLEGTSRNLNPDFSLATLLQPWQVKVIKQRLSPKQIFRRMQSASVDWIHLGESLPRDVADIIAQVKRGRFDVHLDHRKLEQTINRLVLGILSAAMFVGSALLWSQNVSPVVMGISLPGATGCLLGLILGYRLLRAIKRSGDIEEDR